MRAVSELLSPGSLVAGGKYRIVRLLGEGATKIVYLAHDLNLGSDVAFALFKVAAGMDSAGRANVIREGRNMAKLRGRPHVVDVYDAGEEAGQPYLVSQFMPGGSLADLLNKSPEHRLPLKDAIRIADEVCQALEHAHSLGIVHRDLKPLNVWLTQDGEAKLGDFGLAITTDPAGSIGSSISAHSLAYLSPEGALAAMVGTAYYMPPEQALGRPVDARSDLYSLGATLYEILTGRPPFLGSEPFQIAAQHINSPPTPPSQVSPGVPPALDELILRLLAKVPQERPRSASEVREMLRAISLHDSIDTLAESVARQQPELPSARRGGTVSVLFTDIEDYTVMTEALGDLRAQHVLEEHNTIVRREVREHEGFEVKSMGDGFMITFLSARQALLCAIDIQRAFVAYRGNHPDEPIHVRIGLHVGEALRDKDDFYGTTVIVAARIAQQARPDEIAVSGTFRDVVAGGKFRFRGGRQVRLKGIYRKHRVYTVLWSRDRHTLLVRFKRSCPDLRSGLRRSMAKIPLAALYGLARGAAVSMTSLILSDQVLRTLVSLAGGLLLSLSAFVAVVLLGLLFPRMSGALSGLLGLAATVTSMVWALAWLRRESWSYLGWFWLYGSLTFFSLVVALGAFQGSVPAQRVTPPNSPGPARTALRSGAGKLGERPSVASAATITAPPVAINSRAPATSPSQTSVQPSLGGVAALPDRGTTQAPPVSCTTSANFGIRSASGTPVSSQPCGSDVSQCAKDMDSCQARAQRLDRDAAAQLGYIYMNGLGVLRDQVKARNWSNVAATMGSALGQDTLGQTYMLGVAGVEQDYRRAQDLFAVAAAQGCALAQTDLGDLYLYGKGVERNPSTAVEWYQKAADQNDAVGQNNLGFTYSRGLGVNKDFKQALEWYQKSAQQGNPFAQDALGYMYQMGWAVDRDPAQAFVCYSKAAEQGLAEAELHLGDLYKRGEGVAQNAIEAAKWYCKAAAAGNLAGIVGAQKLGVQDCSSTL